MALIKCPECGNDVSDTAQSCPHCGAPIKGSAEAHATGTPITTTQATSKRLKLHQILSLTLFFIGITWLFIAINIIADMPDADVNTVTPGLMTLFGGIWFFITKFRMWWHHR